MIEDLQKIGHPIEKTIVIANKMDLNPYTKPEDFSNELLPLDNIITASAIHKMNIPYLMQCLTSLVHSGEVQQGSSIVSNSRHLEALQGAKQSLEMALSNMDAGVTSDFIAMDIRSALFHIGTITGQVGVEDLLDNIFSKFCIGK